MGRNIGDRVGAMLSAKDGVVNFLGYGVYEGEQVPEGIHVGFLGMCARNKMRNPRIRLDSGDIVWGCECWWGSEESIKRELESGRFAGWKVVPVSISSFRAGPKADPDDGVQSL